MITNNYLNQETRICFFTTSYIPKYVCSEGLPLRTEIKTTQRYRHLERDFGILRICYDEIVPFVLQNVTCHNGMFYFCYQP